MATANPIAPIAFPDDTPGQVATRDVHLSGLTQPANPPIGGQVTVEFGDETVVAPFGVNIANPPLIPAGSVEVDAPGRVSVDISEPRQDESNYPDRWSFTITVTTL